MSAADVAAATICEASASLFAAAARAAATFWAASESREAAASVAASPAATHGCCSEPRSFSNSCLSCCDSLGGMSIPRLRLSQG